GTVCEGATFAYEGAEYAAGSYEFPQTDANGCPYLITLVVDEYPATPDETVTGTVCEGATFAYEGAEYAAGSYEFPQVDANGCPYLITLVVDEFGPTSVDAGGDMTICAGDEITLTATGDGTFEWSNGESGASITVAPTQTTTYTVTATTAEGCQAQDTVTVTVDQKVNIGDFVFEDLNENGIQDDGSTGVNGVTVMLYTCSDSGNTSGDLVGTTVTADSPTTGEPGHYAFEVCPNSGPYYIVFDNIPADFEFTTANNGDDTLDSDADANGATDCFEVGDVDDTSIDAGITGNLCEVFIASKILPRDTPNFYTPRDEDSACLGDTLYLWLYLDVENINTDEATYDGEDFVGWSFTYQFPNGKTFTKSDASEQSYRAVEFNLRTVEFGEYRITWTRPDGCTGTKVFTLNFPDEGCDLDGTRTQGSSQIISVFPVPALSGSSVTLAIDTVNGGIDDGTNNISAVSLRAPIAKGRDNVTVTMFDASGRMVGNA
ncbi:SdrD B-like domain-containing protein, partial [uncultured Croceitalea sp.]|uniref:SdrD B-like domain-containing protein n=1 Tax=uncultured Croceitalea sp. TaxID=1798908 RepID=UPI0033066D42